MQKEASLIKNGKGNMKMWIPKPMQEEDDDLLRPRRLITLTEFLPRNFLDGHPEEVLEVNVCHVVSIKEVGNNYASSKEVDNPNETKQRTFIFDRIKPSTT
ncbi:hypothetical protein E5676_scaffold16540G00020 [Cucumis melo var. makuwa]|uniref:Retrotransposon gag protein n=1 Tax=Cucumis melo var. makuwa TaxID=1194695 RepID=A0A5A7UC87_CUCMM|nr:hypothetical protein E6C27_scaffold190G00320 [Cucumis melo var. makuwa]TYK02122.1 hypothetical protein E5676_scaffold16540G00020 [Cucumis melo var. makuwa]